MLMQLLMNGQRGGGAGAPAPSSPPPYKPLQFGRRAQQSAQAGLANMPQVSPQAAPMQMMGRTPQAPRTIDPQLTGKTGLSGLLMGTGLGMMAQSDTPGQSFLGNLGRSLPMGMQMRDQARQDTALSDVLRGAPGSMQQLMKMAPQMAMSLRPEQGDQTIMSGPNGAIYAIDESGTPKMLVAGEDGDESDYELWLKHNPGGSFEEYYEWRQGASRSPPTRPFTFIGPDGEEKYGLMNPETNTIEAVNGGVPVPSRGGGSNTESSKKARAFLRMIPASLAYIDEYQGAPSRGEEAATARGLREFTDDDQQILSIHSGLLAEAFLRMTTGAAYNAQEFENAQSFFSPRAGDRAETLQVKSENRRKLLEMLQELAGGAVEGSGAPGYNVLTDPNR